MPVVTSTAGDVAHPRILVMRVKVIVMDLKMGEPMMDTVDVKVTLSVAATIVRNSGLTIMRRTIAVRDHPIHRLPGDQDQQVSITIDLKMYLSHDLLFNRLGSLV